MQHYGVPTRVLDLTTNALIALYFACNEKSGNKGKNGEVLVFDIPKEYICFSDSDRITALSNLAKCDSYFYYKKELLPIYIDKIKFLENKKLIQIKNIDNKILQKGPQSYIKEYRNGVLDYVGSKKEKIEEYLVDKDFEFEDSSDDYLEKITYDYKQDKNEFYADEIKNIVIDIIIGVIQDIYIPQTISRLNNNYFGKLLHNIREDKSYFQPIINPNDIGSVFAVIPKMDNPRIIRQSGAFLLFGIKESPAFEISSSNKQVKPMAEIDRKWIIRGNKDKGKRILIDKSSKSDILKELEMLGINKSSIFPEIESIAESVKNKYKK